MSYNHGGYDNEDGFGRERPQKEILFRAETMREILSEAARTGSHDLGPELMASISQSNRQSPPRSSVSRQNSNMMNTPPRDNYGSGIRTYRNRDGDLVTEHDGDEELGLRVYNPDPEWNDNKPKAPSRTGTGISSYKNADGDYVLEGDRDNLPLRAHYQDSPPPSEGRTSPPIYQSVDREGNRYQEYNGDSAHLPIRTHYEQDEPQQAPTRQFQRTNSGRY